MKISKKLQINLLLTLSVLTLTAPLAFSRPEAKVLRAKHWDEDGDKVCRFSSIKSTPTHAEENPLLMRNTKLCGFSAPYSKSSGIYTCIKAHATKKQIPTAEDVARNITKKSALVSEEHASNLEKLAKGIFTRYNEKPAQIRDLISRTREKLTVRTRNAFEAMGNEIINSIEKETKELISIDYKTLSSSEGVAKEEKF